MAMELQAIFSAVREQLETIAPAPAGGVHRRGFASLPVILPRIIFDNQFADDDQGGDACQIGGEVTMLVELHGKPETEAELKSFNLLANKLDAAMRTLREVTIPADTETECPPVYINGFWRESPIDRPTSITDANGHHIPVRAVGGLYTSSFEAI